MGSRKVIPMIDADHPNLSREGDARGPVDEHEDESSDDPTDDVLDGVAFENPLSSSDDASLSEFGIVIIRQSNASICWIIRAAYVAAMVSAAMMMEVIMMQLLIIVGVVRLARAEVDDGNKKRR
eukprot:CAMPEP_0119561844 /NCGR_PEP_ID=MMETSP1352-20130426/18807_1 /TAXON_ID=265584 /ORGANISM="Stauroneis constricta, Strain CCMP1120" /LENGTH=123 /DNA_ID=CAMNT_0007610137 /DNA_START=393 /DNA_END=765 /DNA_ORIENTATION=+